MRESFGGAFMIKLMLIFIVFFVSFMAIIMSIARTYRVKNQVINIVEQYQYTGQANEIAEEKIVAYLDNINYPSIKGEVLCDKGKLLYKNNVCIEKKGSTDLPYYKVTVYVQFEFPLFGLNYTMPISGETKVIRY